MTTLGILLPFNGSEPYPLSVTDAEQINDIVGGYFTVVEMDYSDELLEIMEMSDEQSFVAIGYVNEHVNRDDNEEMLPINVMASIMFNRDIYGPCVVVSGTNPKTGERDGDDYDVPSWFCDRVFDGSLQEISDMTTDAALLTSEAIKYCVITGFYSTDEFLNLMSLMKNPNEETYETIDTYVREAVQYYVGAIQSEHGSVADGAEAFLRETNGGE